MIGVMNTGYLVVDANHIIHVSVLTSYYMYVHS